MYDLQPTEQSRKSGWLTKAFWLCVLIASLIAILFVFMSCMPVKPSALPQRIVQSIPTKSIQLATSVVMPTVAPTVAAFTPVPTSTSLPVVVPTKADIKNDPVLKAYVLNLQSALTMYTGGTKMLSGRFAEAGVSPILMTTSLWKSETHLGLTELSLYSTVVRKLTPPSYLVDANADFLIAADRVDAAVLLLTNGVDNLDAPSLKAGLIELKLANSSFFASSAKLDTFMKNNGINP